MNAINRVPSAALLCLAAALGWNGWVSAGSIPESQSQGRPASRKEILQQKRQAKLRNLTPQSISKSERRILSLEKGTVVQKMLTKGFSGVRLLIGGMPPGSGFAYGVGYVNGFDRESFRFSLDARYSTKEYEKIDGLIEFPTPVSELPLQAYIKAGYSDLKEVNFFGIGNFSSDNDESTFRIEERSISAGATFKPFPLFELGGEVGLIDTSIFSGDDDPSLEELFDPDSVPGFFLQPQYLKYGGHAQFNFFDRGFPQAGLSFRAEVSRYDGRGANDPAGGGFNFTRAVGEVQLHAPLGVRSRRLAFRFRTSHSMADDGDQVPFYMLETIGGTRSVRGFEEFRFRDLRNLVMNLEYRWEVWTYADLALFADAGKVFRDTDDFDFNDLHAGYGIGILARLPGGMRFRIDLAKSNEGIVLHIGSGPNF